VFFFYHRITEKALRQKPVQNGHKKLPKNKASGGRILLGQKQLFLAVYVIYWFVAVYKVF